jgi:hypothetical protein
MFDFWLHGKPTDYPCFRRYRQFPLTNILLALTPANWGKNLKSFVIVSLARPTATACKGRDNKGMKP